MTSTLPKRCSRTPISPSRTLLVDSAFPQLRSTDICPPRAWRTRHLHRTRAGCGTSYFSFNRPISLGKPWCRCARAKGRYIDFDGQPLDLERAPEGSVRLSSEIHEGVASSKW